MVAVLVTDSGGGGGDMERRGKVGECGDESRKVKLA